MRVLRSPAAAMAFKVASASVHTTVAAVASAGVFVSHGCFSIDRRINSALALLARFMLK
jgi:hypothetical protein